jgi:hypothetical protein
MKIARRNSCEFRQCGDFIFGLEYDLLIGQIRAVSKKQLPKIKSLKQFFISLFRLISYNLYPIYFPIFFFVLQLKKL